MSRLPDATAPLDAEAARAAFDQILDGAVAADEIAQFLTDMSVRGESSTEIAAAVRAMRARMIRVKAPDNAIDVCGTGGDGAHSLNISTAQSGGLIESWRGGYVGGVGPEPRPGV